VTSKAQAINGPITNAAMIFTFIPTSNLHCRLARGSQGERLGSKLT
jgi:hypothetical protein